MQSSDKRLNTRDEHLLYFIELISASSDENGVKMQVDCPEKNIFGLKLKFPTEKEVLEKKQRY